MKINHKPIKKRKGKNQKLIKDYKSKSELQIEIKILEESRYNHYKNLVNDIHLEELNFKKSIFGYDIKGDNYKRLYEEYKEKKNNLTESYNEAVKPIDKQLKELRVQLINNYTTEEIKRIDKRLKY